MVRKRGHDEMRQTHIIVCVVEWHVVASFGKSNGTKIDGILWDFMIWEINWTQTLEEVQQ